jgi:ATPase subunit of ABC transporter with duplicated ATPase domains
MLFCTRLYCYLEQEPLLDDSKTVIEIVREGVAETMAVLEEFNQINDSFGLPEVYEDADKMDKLMDRRKLCCKTKLMH